MSGLLICLLSFGVCLQATRHSLGTGVGAFLAFGYAFGILRANFLDGFSHFIVDSGVIGLYAAQFSKPLDPKIQDQAESVRGWLLPLIVWPIFLFFLPINHYLVQLVGLRHIIIFLPAMLLGAQAKREDLNAIANSMAVLTFASLGFAIAQYYLGIELFFPHNSATELLYKSQDVAAGKQTFHRIPSIFVNSHAFAGTMVASIPFLINSTADKTRSMFIRLFFLSAILAALLGVFMAGPRSPFVVLILCLVLVLVLPGLKLSAKTVLLAFLILLGIASIYVVSSDERLQRITTLGDTDMVLRRTNSGNFDILESLFKFPIGVGLGGVFGSSMPFFLADLIKEGYGAENEYARIALEQGVVGFLIWFALVLRLFIAKPKRYVKQWRLGIQMMWAMVIVIWGTAFIGVGVLNSVPVSLILLFEMGLLLRLSTESSTSPKPKSVVVVDATESAGALPATPVPFNSR